MRLALNNKADWKTLSTPPPRGTRAYGKNDAKTATIEDTRVTSKKEKHSV